MPQFFLLLMIIFFNTTPTLGMEDPPSGEDVYAESASSSSRPLMSLTEKVPGFTSTLKAAHPDFAAYTDELVAVSQTPSFKEKSQEVISYLEAIIAFQQDLVEESQFYAGLDLSTHVAPLKHTHPHFLRRTLEDTLTVHADYITHLNFYQNIRKFTGVFQKQREALINAPHPLIQMGLLFDMLTHHLGSIFENHEIQRNRDQAKRVQDNPGRPTSVWGNLTIRSLPLPILLHPTFFASYARKDVEDLIMGLRRQHLLYMCVKVTANALPSFDKYPFTSASAQTYMHSFFQESMRLFQALSPTSRYPKALLEQGEKNFTELKNCFENVKRYTPDFQLTPTTDTFYEVCLKYQVPLRGRKFRNYIKDVISVQNLIAQTYQKERMLQMRSARFLGFFERVREADLDPFFNPHSSRFALRDVAVALERGLKQTEVCRQLEEGTLRIHFDEGDLEADGAGGGGGSGGSGASSKKSKKSGGKKGKKGSKKGKKGKKGSSGKKKKGQQKASQSTATSEHAGSESAAEATDASVTVTTTTDIPATHDGAAPAAEAYETSVFSPTKTGKAARKKNAQQLALLRTLRQQAPTMGIDSFAALSRTLKLAPTEFMPLYRHPTSGADQSPEAPSRSPALTWLETQLTTDHQNTFLDILFGRKALLKYVDVFNMFRRMPGVSVTEMGGGSSHKRVVLQTAEREKPFFMGHILKPHGRQVFGRNAITYTKGTLERILEKLGLDITHFEKLR